MKRRTFLRTTIMTGFALSVTPFIPRRPRPTAPADDGSCLDRVPALSLAGEMTPRLAWRLEQLTQAWRRAAAAGKPLLLIVVPTDDMERWCQSNAWGEAITHGPDALIAALSTAVLATATQHEIAALLPSYPRYTPEPSVVRVDVCAQPAAWTQARIAEIYAGGLEDSDEAIDARIDAVHASIAALLPAAGVAEGRVRQDAIPGARWGSAYGCGEEYETEDPLIPNTGWGVDCGMGHVNSRSARFLDFLTQEPPEPRDD